jgi:hypothetical protein
VWNDFVFPGPSTTYDGPSTPAGQQGLQDYLTGELTKALKDFDHQWEVYQNTRRRNSFLGSVPKIYDVPFEPRLKFKGVPDNLLAIQETKRRALWAQMPR